MDCAQNRKLHLSFPPPCSPSLPPSILPIRPHNIQHHCSLSSRSKTKLTVEFFLFLQLTSKFDICELKQNFMSSPCNKIGWTERVACNDCPSQIVCSFWKESSIAFHLDITEICNRWLLHSSNQLSSFRTAAPALLTQKCWHSNWIA